VTSPRIAPGARSEVGLFAWTFARLSGRVTGTTPPNLFLTMGRRKGMFFGWLWFAGRLMPGGKLPRRETELVILRVAHLRDCEYEWTHHERLGGRAGLTAEEIARVRDGADAPEWSERERVLLGAVDELHASADLSDARFAALRQQYSEADVVELVMLAGHYEMLATFINTLRIRSDRARTTP
jgi:AhpD family alkylhydroperoxidase